MMALFEGFSSAHGTYETEDARSGSVKREIKRTAKTVRLPVTEEVWQQHIAGSRNLGIITIREDSKCRWGAIDVDKYDIDHQALVQKLEELKVPAVVCKTKSGGAHIFLFTSEPVPAGDMMSRLRDLASAIGYGDSEVFPKQDTVRPDKGEFGNWLNMPYAGGNDTVRYAVRPDARGMSLDSFLKFAEGRRIDHERLMSLVFSVARPEFADGPPCLEHLSGTGIGEGARNNGLFALGVLAKKIRPDDWEKLLEDWNRKVLLPPLPSGEVGLVIKGLKKQDYNYKCHDQPIVSFCNMPLCRTRKFGIGPGGAAKIVESISILDTDPPIFFVALKTGGVIECDGATLLNPRAFQERVLVQMRQVVPLYKTDDWLRQVQVCVENATRIEAPREVGIIGHFEDLLEIFCTDRHVGETKDDLLLGKPWVEESRGRVYFRLRDLQDHLERSRFRDLSRGQVVTKIREMGGNSDFFNIRGKGVNCWWVPSGKFTWQQESLPTADIDESPL